jgi:hypothetical protein
MHPFAEWSGNQIFLGKGFGWLSTSVLETHLVGVEAKLSSTIAINVSCKAFDFTFHVQTLRNRHQIVIFVQKVIRVGF